MLGMAAAAPSGAGVFDALRVRRHDRSLPKGKTGVNVRARRTASRCRSLSLAGLQSRVLRVVSVGATCRSRVAARCTWKTARIARVSVRFVERAAANGCHGAGSKDPTIARSDASHEVLKHRRRIRARASFRQSPVASRHARSPCCRPIAPSPPARERIRREQHKLGAERASMGAPSPRRRHTGRSACRSARQNARGPGANDTSGAPRSPSSCAIARGRHRAAPSTPPRARRAPAEVRQ